jgi:hypothetical protein
VWPWRCSLAEPIVPNHHFDISRGFGGSVVGKIWIWSENQGNIKFYTTSICQIRSKVIPSSYEIVELLASEWTKLYSRRPKTTLVVTLILLITTSSFFVTQILIQERNREATRLQNSNYTKQLESLDVTRSNLNTLIEFIDNEKRKVELSQQTLKSLKSEHDRLKPLIESDRKIIESIFATQEARNKIDQSNEKYIGFVMGIVTSLVASIIFSGITYVLRRNK